VSPPPIDRAEPGSPKRRLDHAPADHQAIGPRAPAPDVGTAGGVATVPLAVGIVAAVERIASLGTLGLAGAVALVLVAIAAAGLAGRSGVDAR